MKEGIFDKILRQMRLRQIVPHLREFENPRVLDVGCGWEARLLRQIEPFIAKGVGIDFKAPEIETEKLSVFGYVFERKQGASGANSSLGNHCIDLAFRHKARTPSPLSLCQNTKNSTSKTANTRILGETQGDSSDSMESNAESLESSLRGDNSPKQSKKSCEVQPNLAPLRGSEIERKGGSSASALLELECEIARLSPKSETAAAVFRSAVASHQPLARLVGERGGGAALFAKKSDYVNENISAESRRSERAESAESLKDSNDSMEYSNKMDCHDSAMQNLAMTAKGDSVESSEKIKMDLQVWVSCGRNARHDNPCGLSRNDEQKTTLCKNTNSRNDASIGVDCHEFNKLDSRDDNSSLPSLRGKSPKQSIKDEESSRYYEGAKQSIHINLKKDSATNEIIGIGGGI